MIRLLKDDFIFMFYIELMGDDLLVKNDFLHSH